MNETVSWPNVQYLRPFFTDKISATCMNWTNHPTTRHMINSIYSVDPRDVAQGRRVGFSWFSPDCTDHSNAKGGKPIERNRRDLAKVVPHWAKLVRPEVIIVENVAEFQGWGPLRQKHVGGKEPPNAPTTHEEWEALPPEYKGQPQFDKNGRAVFERCPFRKGQTFKKWVRQLRRLGYQVEWRVLRACDFGAPTIRKRLFIIARRDLSLLSRMKARTSNKLLWWICVIELTLFRSLGRSTFKSKSAHGRKFCDVVTLLKLCEFARINFVYLYIAGISCS
jgi:site-specific DNA-cytosine methylase